MKLKSSCTLTAGKIKKKENSVSIQNGCYLIWALNPIRVQVWRDPATPPGLPWKKEPRWDNLASTLSSKPPVTEVPSHPWESFSKDWLFSLLKVFGAASEASPGSTCSCCPLSSLCGSSWRECLHPPCTHPLRSCYSIFSVSSGSVFVCKTGTKFGNHCLINEPSRSLITSTPTSTSHVSTCSHSGIISRLIQAG